MPNNTKATNSRNKKTGVNHEVADQSPQQAAEQHERKDQNEAKLGVTKGLLECCRSRKHSVVSCQGIFK